MPPLGAVRIIGGDRKGARLAAPKGLDTRPTLGRIREALFSMLSPVIRDARVVDLYAGSGALGFEALSRGAAQCTFVDMSRPALQALIDNATRLRYGRDRALFESAEVLRWVRNNTAAVARANIVFADPPYGTPDSARLLELLGTIPWQTSAPIIVIQTGRQDALGSDSGSLAAFDHRHYGETSLHLFSRREALDDSQV